MKYDPNWLQKERAKNWARQERQMSHVVDETKNADGRHSTMLCGRGWGAVGHPSITTVSFPSLTSLPTCRQCREKFLASIGVTNINPQTGYPL
jgi:hypothetical protein